VLDGESVEHPFDRHAKHLIADQPGERNTGRQSRANARNGERDRGDRERRDEHERRCGEW
jgi:hypothetical protein